MLNIILRYKSTHFVVCRMSVAIRQKKQKETDKVLKLSRIIQEAII